MPRRTTTHTAARLSDLIPSWELALRAAGKSPKTITSYLASVRALDRFTDADVESIAPEVIRAFLVAERERTSASSAQVHYRNLRVWFGWLIGEGERKSASPVTSADKPRAPERVRAYLSESQIKALLKACAGDCLEARRDLAIVRILIDNGVRVSGLAGLRLEDVLLAERRLMITLKGGRQTYIPIGAKAATAIDRYLRLRARCPDRDSPWLWVGTRGRNTERMTASGIQQMLRRRGEQAGVEDVYPHRFRHTFADSFLANGGSVDDLMHIAGWTTYDMPLRYAKLRGIDRAAIAHARLSPGDRL